MKFLSEDKKAARTVNELARREYGVVIVAFDNLRELRRKSISPDDLEFDNVPTGEETMKELIEKPKKQLGHGSAWSKE
jgi:hypothetical protein